MRPHAGVGLEGRILRRAAVAQDAQRQAEHTRAGLVVELREGGLVPSRGPVEQRDVLGLRRRHMAGVLS